MVAHSHNFNPRPRKEGDFYRKLSAAFFQAFQSTPSQRGRRLSRQNGEESTLFQSTPSQRGRQYALGGCKVFKIISIHALAKRATKTIFINRLDRRFQSTPSQRGRRIITACNTDNIKFQSTPSQRGRPGAITSLMSNVMISIHALAKRATKR